MFNLNFQPLLNASIKILWMFLIEKNLEIILSTKILKKEGVLIVPGAKNWKSHFLTPRKKTF